MVFLPAVLLHMLETFEDKMLSVHSGYVGLMYIVVGEGGGDMNV